MAAALGTMIVTEQNRKRSISIYASDASNVSVKFDESKVASSGSPDQFTAKQPCRISDICWTSDVATPSHYQFLVNGTPTGDIGDFTANLASVVMRPTVSLPLSPGDKLQIIQIA